MTTASNCPCQTTNYPVIVKNKPGLSRIAYRFGDFASIREALLRSRSAERQLLNWRPRARQDLALQLVEWWAYLSDILSYYNEFIANQDYLRTADQQVNVANLVNVLGYRPRPGIGAVGRLAVLLNRPVPAFLPAGMQFQSKPGPGQQPQIFELDADTTINPPDSLAVDPAPSPKLFSIDNQVYSVLLAGKVAGIKAGDEVLLLKNQSWDANDPHTWTILTVSAAAVEKDSRGNGNTRLTFANKPSLPDSARYDDFGIFKTNLSCRPLQGSNPYYPGEFLARFEAISATLPAEISIPILLDSLNIYVDLEAVIRAINIGDPLIFKYPSSFSNANPANAHGGFSYSLAKVDSYGESVDTINDSTRILHSWIEFALNTFTLFPFDWSANSGQVRIFHGWRVAAELIPTPATVFDPSQPDLIAVPPSSFPAIDAITPVMLMDANGLGLSASASLSGSQPTMSMHLDNLSGTSNPLQLPLQALYGLISVSRGKSVSNEILGSGNAGAPYQSFVLKNAPLTYLLSNASGSGQNYISTLRVEVDGIAWLEVPSFFGQAPDAKVFVTREDENQQTHVMFGDGVQGARLGSGVNNVVASYRYGSGAQSPGAGTLNVILQAQPNVKAVGNPVAVGGGADPDSASQLRQLAPRSVTTFGRAISADDYETIAAQAPGVNRAKSYWKWDEGQQRALVTIYVGDDDNAVAAAKTAINASRDPNRPVLILPATPQPVGLSLNILVNPKYDIPTVLNSVKQALLDPLAGLFGQTLSIGQAIHNSLIYQVCLNVPGVAAVHKLDFYLMQRLWFFFEFVPLEIDGTFVAQGEQHEPGDGNFFQLQEANLTMIAEVAGNVA